MGKVRWLIQFKGKHTWGMVTRGRWEVRFFPFSWAWPGYITGYGVTLVDIGPFTVVHNYRRKG